MLPKLKFMSLEQLGSGYKLSRSGKTLFWTPCFRNVTWTWRVVNPNSPTAHVVMNEDGKGTFTVVMLSEEWNCD